MRLFREGLARKAFLLLGFALLTVGTVIAQAPPATDGLVWGTDSNGFTAPIPQKLADGTYSISAFGQVNTSKYSQMKITGNICTMKITVTDSGGNPDPNQQPKTFLNGTTDQVKGTFSINSGTTSYPKGTWLIVTVQTKVKETPTSAERDAYITARLMCVDPPPPPGGGGGG